MLTLCSLCYFLRKKVTIGSSKEQNHLGLHRNEKVNGGLSFSVKIQCFPVFEVCLCMISLKRNHTFVNECVELSDERSESQYNLVVSSTHSHTPRVCKLVHLL